MRASLSILTVLAALLAPMTLQAPTAQAATVAPVATAADGGAAARVVVRFKADSPLLRKQALATTRAAEHAERARSLGTRLGLVMRAGSAVDERTQVVFADGVTSAQLAAELAAQSDVELAIVDQRRRRMAVPNDPLYASGRSRRPGSGQWYLKPASASAVSSIDAEGAWDITTGSPGHRRRRARHGRALRTSGLKTVAWAATCCRLRHGPRPGDANDGSGRDADASDPGDFITSAKINTVGGPFYGGARPTAARAPPRPTGGEPAPGTVRRPRA
jgi:serine protease